MAGASGAPAWTTAQPKHDIRNKDELREFLRSQYERHPFKGILRQDIERSFAGFDVALKVGRLGSDARPLSLG